MFIYRIAIFVDGSREYLYGAQYRGEALKLAENILIIDKKTNKAIVEEWDSEGNFVEEVAVLECYSAIEVKYS